MFLLKMEIRPLAAAAVLLYFATLSASQRVEPCQSGEDCPDDQCCVVLPWIPSNKGGVCAKHTQRGEVCWPPHHDYKKYLFYCPCGKELKCKPLHAFEKEQNMTFHLDVCVDDNGENEGQETENPDNVDDPEGGPEVSSEGNPEVSSKGNSEKKEKEGEDNSEKEENEGNDNQEKEENEGDKHPEKDENEGDDNPGQEEDEKQEGDTQDENDEPEAEKDDDYSDYEANPDDDDDNSDDEETDEDYNEPTEEYRNEEDEDYNEPAVEYNDE